MILPDDYFTGTLKHEIRKTGDGSHNPPCLYKLHGIFKNLELNNFQHKETNHGGVPYYR